VALVWSVDAVVRHRRTRSALAGVAAAGLVALAIATWIQIGHWRDQVSLFTHALEVTEGTGRAHHLLSQGLIALDPGYAEAHGNLAIAYGRAGRTDEAMPEMRLEMQLRSVPR
jgi:hypothetical protein